MTGKVVVFAPGAGDADDTLSRTRWMADRTLEMLAEDHHEGAAVVDERATRIGLAAAMTDAVVGVAFFSHGRSARFGHTEAGPAIQDDAIMGMDGAALDRENLDIMAGRWGHAVACHAGTELAAQACAAGATCFVGYEGTLKVEWEPENIPSDVTPLFVDLVTRTTRNLAAGVRDEQLLRRHVNDIAEAITEWCLAHPDEPVAMYLEVTAQQLVDRLVYCPAGAPARQ